MSEKYIFQEFSSVSAKEWKQKIQFELKGSDYNDALVWESLEGIHVKPFYHYDNFEYLDIPTSSKDFEICQSIFVDDVEIANKIAIEALKNGVTAIQFIANKSFDIDVLFQGFKNEKSWQKIYFKNHFFSKNFNIQLLEYFQEDRLVIQQDCIGELAENGDWFFDKNEDLEATKKLVSKYPNAMLIGVDASIYQNAGANTVQQVAYALAHANEYLNHIGEKTCRNIQFEFAIGSNYFFEIAKLRAFRYLWKKLTSEYGKECPVQLLTKSTLRNKTLFDYNVNLLRITTENMSAVLGGADTVVSQAYDAIFKKSNTFSQRIAKNQLLLLKEENGFIKAQDFAKGSYYIEHLTYEIARKALKIVKQIEKSGGFITLLKKGVIQQKIEESHQKEKELFNKGEIVLLGTNKYPNIEDKMKENIDLYPFLKKDKKQTKIQPIFARRLAEKTEQDRLALE